MSFVRPFAIAQVVALFLVGCAAEEPDEAASTTEAAIADNAVSYDGVHLLDVYQPATPGTKRPLAVWIHGGAFAYNTRRDGHLVRLAQHTASLGYVSVSIDYTLANAGFDEANPFPYPGTAIAAARDDTRAAIRFLRAHADDYGIDPDHIVIGGASAGAVTALAVAYGPTPANRDPGIRAVIDLWGAFESPALLEPGDAPLLILHGTADQHWMPFAQAEKLNASAKAARVPCTFIPLPGKNHGPWEDLDSYLGLITTFLRDDRR